MTSNGVGESLEGDLTPQMTVVLTSTSSRRGGRARLLALPGVGPYAAAHVMLTSLGRYSRLVLDSWTRPTYGKLAGARRTLKDTTIERRFKRYGDWAGLAFWLYLTRAWVEDGLPV